MLRSLLEIIGLFITDVPYVGLRTCLCNVPKLGVAEQLRAWHLGSMWLRVPPAYARSEETSAFSSFFKTFPAALFGMFSTQTISHRLTL